MGDVILIKRGTRAQIDAAATAGALRAGELYLISDEARLAAGIAPDAYQAAARQGEADGGSHVSQVDQAYPVYVMREPYGTQAWTIVRGDGLRATPLNNPSHASAAEAWAARAALVYA